MQRRKPTLIEFFLIIIIIISFIYIYKTQNIEPNNNIISSAKVRIIDGDTIELKTKIRLASYDSLESNQLCKDSGGKCWPCGIKATQLLHNLLKNKRVTCILSGKKSYGREIGSCYIQEGKQKIWLGQYMVASGFGFIDPRFAKTYKTYEDQARTQKLGAWSSDFLQPWIYRKNKQNVCN